MSENAYAQWCPNCGADYPNADNYLHTCLTSAFVQPVLIGVEKTAAVSMVEAIARLEAENAELRAEVFMTQDQCHDAYLVQDELQGTIADLRRQLAEAGRQARLYEADLAAARGEVQRWADLMTSRSQERDAARADARVLQEALWEVLDSLGALGGSWWELDGLANARAKEICALAATKEETGCH